MYAARPLHFANFIDHIDTDIHAFLPLILGTGETFNNRIGNMHTGDIISNPLCGFGRSQWTNAGLNKDFFMQTHISNLGHILFQHGNIKTVLGLNKLGTSSDFFR
jgi:hypothetical protein